MVIPHGLGHTGGFPPLHVGIEPSGGPLNRMFGHGTPLRARVATAALLMQDRVARAGQADSH